MLSSSQQWPGKDKWWSHALKMSVAKEQKLSEKRKGQTLAVIGFKWCLMVGAKLLPTYVPYNMPVWLKCFIMAPYERKRATWCDSFRCCYGFIQSRTTTAVMQLAKRLSQLCWRRRSEKRGWREKEREVQVAAQRPTPGSAPAFNLPQPFSEISKSHTSQTTHFHAWT